MILDCTTAQQASADISPAIAAIIGAVVGGLISFFTSLSLENRRYTRQKHDEKMKVKREAIASISSWDHSIFVPINKAWMTVSSYVYGDLTPDEFREKFPTDIRIEDAPQHLIQMLPEGTYDRFWEMHGMLGKIKIEMLSNPIKQYNEDSEEAARMASKHHRKLFS